MNGEGRIENDTEDVMKVLFNDWANFEACLTMAAEVI